MTPLASHCHYSCPWPSSGGRAVGSLPSPPVCPGSVSSPEGLCSDVLSPFKIFLLSEILKSWLQLDLFYQKIRTTEKALELWKTPFVVWKAWIPYNRVSSLNTRICPVKNDFCCCVGVSHSSRQRRGIQSIFVECLFSMTLIEKTLFVSNTSWINWLGVD